MLIEFPKTLMNSIENGHMLIDTKFTVHYWNKWLEINTQIPYTEIVGKNLKEFYPDLNYNLLKRKIKTALILGTPSFYDNNSKTKFISINRNKVTTSSLTLMQQQVTISPYLIDDGVVMISIYDISELHETKLLLKKEIEKVNKLNVELESRVEKALEENKENIKKMILQSRLAQMGEMISMIAHQWRQPLSTISGILINTQMMSEMKKYDLEKKEEAKEYESVVNQNITSISEFIQILSKTIDDFRNFFKTNKNTTNSQIHEPILKALSIIKEPMINDGISVYEIYESEIKFDMLYDELMQVFLNIFKNAKDNFKEKGIKEPKIFIKTYDTDDHIVVEIIDNGRGIKKDLLDKIFEPYFSTKGKNGTGLGLYMSKIIVQEHHNGEIFASNRDNGLSITIKIPK